MTQAENLREPGAAPEESGLRLEWLFPYAHSGSYNDASANYGPVRLHASNHRYWPSASLEAGGQRVIAHRQFPWGTPLLELQRAAEALLVDYWREMGAVLGQLSAETKE